MRARRSDLLWWAALVGMLEALLVGFATSRRLYGDSFYDLVAGREIVNHGFSHTDPWTFLGAGRRWIDEQWLAHVTYYAASAAGGLRAVSILSAILVGAGVGVLAALMTSRGTTPARVAVWAALAAVVAEANAVVRAQSFAYLAFAIALALLLADWDAPAPKRRAALVLTLLLWANLHGSVVVFALVVAIAWSWRVVQALRASEYPGAARAAGWVALACIASLTTPFGFAIVGYYRSELSNTTLQQHISEWHAANILDPFEVLFFVALVATLIACAYALRARMRLPLPLVVATLVYGYSGFEAQRAEVWFTFVAIIVIAEVLTRRDSTSCAGATRRVPRLDRRIAAPAVIGATAVLIASMTGGPALAYQTLPLRAIDRAAALGGTHALICADNDTSTPLEWRHPDTRGRVAFDARYELYSQTQLRQIFGLLEQPQQLTQPAWLARCDVFLIDLHAGTHTALARMVRGLPGYRIAFDRPGLALVAVRSR